MAKNTKTTDKETVYCTGCDKEKQPKDFYKSYGTTKSGLLPFCKECCHKKSLGSNGEIDIENFQKMLMQVDRPYLEDIFNKNLEKFKGNSKRIIGYYFKDLGLKDYRMLTYKESVFDGVMNNLGAIKKNPLELDRLEREQLIEKWGFGYSDKELIMFEKKFNLLKDNYPLRTAMHIEALCTYTRYRVKEEMATASGNVGEASKWGSLADKAAQSAKINPSQLSKADLSGGLNGFGELVRAVEQAVDIIAVLPVFKEKPQDKVDETLLHYINYVRRLKNLPDVEYKDIWNFLEERKKEYEVKSSSKEEK